MAIARFCCDCLAVKNDVGSIDIAALNSVVKSLIWSFSLQHSVGSWQASREQKWELRRWVTCKRYVDLVVSVPDVTERLCAHHMCWYQRHDEAREEQLRKDLGTRRKGIYCKISNIRHTKSLHLIVPLLFLQMSLPNPMKPDVRLKMKMLLEQRRQAMLQLHLSDGQCYW